MTGLFTGLTLTALVLILSSPKDFEVPFGSLSGTVYFQIVATYVALLGVASSVAMLSFLEIAGGMMQTLTPIDTFGTVFFFVTVFGFLGALPLLLAPFTSSGATTVLLGEVGVLLTWAYVRRFRSAPRSARGRSTSPSGREG